VPRGLDLLLCRLSTRVNWDSALQEVAHHSAPSISDEASQKTPTAVPGRLTVDCPSIPYLTSRSPDRRSDRQPCATSSASDKLQAYLTWASFRSLNCRLRPGTKYSLQRYYSIFRCKGYYLLDIHRALYLLARFLNPVFLANRFENRLFVHRSAALVRPADPLISKWFIAESPRGDVRCAGLDGLRYGQPHADMSSATATFD
jgi:hypothetical protein